MRKLTQEKFLCKCRNIHYDLYDYSKVKYIKSTEKIIIICRKHGEFSQIASSHSTGHGCNLCAVEYNNTLTLKNNDVFISECAFTHGNKYNYSFTIYKGANKKIKIVCDIHGVFNQVANKHRMGDGCPECAPNSPVFFDEFVNRSKKIHGDKYNYHKTSYIGMHKKTKITCNSCSSDFMQYPTDHSTGKGCSKCARYGFDPQADGFIYVLLSRCEKYIKIGISNCLDERISLLKSRTPFKFNLLYSRKSIGNIIRATELELHSNLINANLDNIYGKFDGFTEWFLNSDDISEEILENVLCYNNNYLINEKV